MTYRAHYTAFRGLLVASEILSDKTHDALVPEDAEGELLRANYCVIYHDDLDREQTRQSAPQELSRQAFEFAVQSVGIDVLSCLLIAETVAKSVLGKRPAIEGRNAFAVRSLGMDRVQPDRSIRPPIFFTEERFVLESDPA